MLPHLLEQLELTQKSLSAYLGALGGAGSRGGWVGGWGRCGEGEGRLGQPLPGQPSTCWCIHPRLRPPTRLPACPHAHPPAETKRSEFPRFYFVSDPTLLECLSMGSDPPSVVPHFQSGLFDSLSNVSFDKARTGSSLPGRLAGWLLGCGGGCCCGLRGGAGGVRDPASWAQCWALPTPLPTPAHLPHLPAATPRLHPLVPPAGRPHQDAGDVQPRGRVRAVRGARGGQGQHRGLAAAPGGRHAGARRGACSLWRLGLVASSQRPAVLLALPPGPLLQHPPAVLSPPLSFSRPTNRRPP